MESFPIREARRRLGELHAAAIHGEAPRLRRERAARHADQEETTRIKPYLDVGQTPPGYEVYTREQVISGDWLA